MSMRRLIGVLCGLTVGFGATAARGQAVIPIGDPCEIGVNDNCEDDGIFCTAEFCDGDVCVRILDDLSCSAGVGPCSGVITCDPTSPLAGADGCVASGNPCIDGIDCTKDDCIDNMDGTFTCDNSVNSGFCEDDGIFCNGTEFCDTSVGCAHTGNLCPFGQVCDENPGVCRDCVSDEECDDGIACNGAETCEPCVVAGCSECVRGPSPCDDGIPCTVDQCDENNPDNMCTNTPDDSLCPDDGNPCTTAKCDAITGCSQVQKDCDDNISCTLDSCNTDTVMCEHTPQNSACSDSVFCNGDETCNPANPNSDPTTGCVPGTAPQCDPGFTCSAFCGDRCVRCETDADCDDGNACNGREICADALTMGCASTCKAAPSDDPCPTDPNAECVRMQCVNDGNNQFHCQGTPDDSLCDNGLFCDGKEVCDPACTTAACQAVVVAGPGGGINLTGCVAGTPPNCNDDIGCTQDECSDAQSKCVHTLRDAACSDQVDCTVDKCDPANGDPTTGCTHTKDDSFCDDNRFCNGQEVCFGDCNVAGGCSGCERGDAPDCDDGIFCTEDSCDEDRDACVHTPHDLVCSDGIGCNGKETCSASSPACGARAFCCGKGCEVLGNVGDCLLPNVAGVTPVFGPVCAPVGCDEENYICCAPGKGCTLDPLDISDCLDARGIPICIACQDLLCCQGPNPEELSCVPNNNPDACVEDNGLPVCGDCGNVRCCPDPDVAGATPDGGCLNLPLDLCVFVHGFVDCSGCEHGTPPSCDDHLDCTADECVEGQKLDPYFCRHVPDDTVCDDGIFCNGKERCVLPPPPPFVAGAGNGLPSGCQSSPPPVCPTGLVCDPCVDGCAKCLSDAECIDSNPCTLDTCAEVTTGVFDCIHKLIDGCTPPAATTTSFTQKGSLLIFSKIELKWDNDGKLLQDTFLSLYNDDDGSAVEVQAYFINGDVPLEEVCMGDPCVQIVQEQEPGWNTADCRFTLTKSNPIYWSAARGGGNLAHGGGNCQPFTVLDDSFPPGRPDPENGMRTRILRGYVILWAVALNECVTGVPNGRYEEIRWNDLTGEALIVNYERGYAWDYKPWAFQAHGVEHGEFTGTPGVLNLDGVEYDAPFSRLLLDFQASGSQGYLQVNRDGRPGLVVTGDTDLTLHPVPADLRQDNDGPIVTKAEFSIFNEFEAKFSGTRRCIQCWDQRLLSHYTASGVPNHFNRTALGTDAGVARIEGVASTECNGLEPFFERSQAAPLLGVSAKVLSFGASPSTQEEWAGTNLVGNGAAKAVIRYDLSRGSGDVLRLAPSKASDRAPSGATEAGSKDAQESR